MTDAATTARAGGSSPRTIDASTGYLGSLPADAADRRRAAWIAGLLVAAFLLTAGQASRTTVVAVEDFALDFAGFNNVFRQGAEHGCLA